MDASVVFVGMGGIEEQALDGGVDLALGVAGRRAGLGEALGEFGGTRIKVFGQEE